METEVARIVAIAVVKGGVRAIKEKDLGLGISAFSRSVKGSMSSCYDKLSEKQNDCLMELRGWAARHGPMDGVGE